MLNAVEAAEVEIADVNQEEGTIEEQKKAYREYVNKLLDESLEYSKRPDALWYSSEEFWAMMDNKFPNAL
ncbi:hypothetical protein AGMMS50212_10880 [Spirochaetia bacterium]|nr:hypothetical protein AGMMS50212_10880 [Spirochaetia bacterium]